MSVDATGRNGQAEADARLRVGMAAESGGVALSFGEIRRRRGAPPTMKLGLRHPPEPPPEAEPFSPFRFPSELAASLTGVDLALLESARADVELRLRPGMSGVPLADGSPVLFEFAEGASASGVVEVAAESVEPGERVPVVHVVDLRFEPAVVIHNVLHALSEVRQLFEDRTLSALLRSVPIHKALSRLQAFLPEGIREVASVIGDSDQLGVVHLERARAKARWRRRTRTWELRISFSGTLHLAGGVVRPFRDVELPNVLLPTPYAQLDRLLSRNPLASAEVAADERRLPPLLRGLLAAVEGAQGRLRMEARLPQVDLETRFVDDTRMAAGIRLSERLRAEGPFRADITPDESRLRMDGLVVGLPDDGLVVDADLRLRHDLEDGEQSWDERVGVVAEIGLRKGSRIPEVGLVLRRFHPLCSGELRAPLVLRDFGLHGTGALSFEQGRLSLRPTTRRFAFHGDLRTADDGRIDLPGASAHTTVEGGHVRGGFELDESGTWRVRFDAGADVLSAFQLRVPDVPEISVQAGHLSGVFSGRVELLGSLDFGFPRPNAPQINFRGSAVRLASSLARLQLGTRQLRLPPGAKAEVKARKGRFGVSGPEDIALSLLWDLPGDTVLEDRMGRAVSLFAEGLRKDRLDLTLRPSGRVSLEGTDKGLYGINFFNALLNPAANPRHLLDVLRSEESMSYVLRALAIFAPEFSEVFEDVRTAVLTARSMLDRERIREPRDLIPRERIARFLSLLIVGTPALTERLVPVVRRATEGGGLDVPEVKAILREQLDELHYDYEIDRAVRWLDVALAPTGLTPPPPRREMLPIGEDPRFAEERRGLPTAREIYERVEQHRVSPGFANLLADLAPFLSRSQLSWILRHRSARWGEQPIARMRYAHEVKRRVERIASAFGGMQYAPQAPWISFFLAEAADWDASRSTPPLYAALGPEEVAALLRAGLSSGRQGRQTQVNNRLLIQLMECRGPDFVVAVFAELGNQNPRALSSALMSFLDQDQDQLCEPVDLPRFLEEHLGLEAPRRAQYLAGGSRARKSYSEALDRLADSILVRSEGYRSRKQHLQVVRHEPRPLPPLGRGDHGALAERAHRAIEEADAYAGTCRFEGARVYRAKGDGAGDPEEARYAYGLACGACARLLRAEPAAFRAPWFRSFWARNEEALRVLSVVRNYQQDIDDVRYWLHIRRGLRTPLAPATGGAHEQRLLDEVVRALYVFPQDQRALRRDPLVRLLIDPDLGTLRRAGRQRDGRHHRGRQGARARRRLPAPREAAGCPGASSAHGHGTLSSSTTHVRILEGRPGDRRPLGLHGLQPGLRQRAQGREHPAGRGPPTSSASSSASSLAICCSVRPTARPTAARATRSWPRSSHDAERHLKPYQALYSGPVTRLF